MTRLNYSSIYYIVAWEQLLVDKFVMPYVEKLGVLILKVKQ
jgi:hypothetical protein